MNTKTKKRSCKYCGKLLINEKKSICKRCDLKTKKKQMTIGGIVVSVIIGIVGSVKALAGNKKSKHGTKTV
ncbi:MAG: hypothetical protein HDR53_07670 [Treponema sp.]|nr:hypothetical protein [Treponema sp.]